MNDTPNILPCPFCGATHDALDKNTSKGVYAYYNAPASEIDPWIHVVCLECLGAAPTIETWNRRAAQWHHKATAPDNQTRVLAICIGVYEPCVGSIIGKRFFPDGQSGSEPFTHWIPLSALPNVLS